MWGGVARSHTELDERDLDFWLSVDPAERIGAACSLHEEARLLRGDAPFPRLEAFAASGVEYVLVGGYAVIFHGRPRATKDIDLLVSLDGDNREKLARALRAFGVPDEISEAARTLAADEVVYFG
jgi:hypothetical protein